MTGLVCQEDESADEVRKWRIVSSDNNHEPMTDVCLTSSIVLKQSLLQKVAT